MSDAWEKKAIEVRNRAREASKEMRDSLYSPKAMSPDAMTGLQGGVAVVDITPDKPMYLDGYWGERLSTDVHDPLSVKALVLDDGRTRIALVSVDVISLYYQWTIQARAMQNAVPAENVIITSTHTHACPCFVGLFGPPGSVDPDYVEHVCKSIGKAINQAALSLRPVKLGFGQAAFPLVDGEIPNFARNWHSPGNMDPTLMLMQVADLETDDVLLNMLNFGNHPDVLGDATTAISADIFGYTYEWISEKLGGDTMIIQRGLGGVEPIPQGLNPPDDWDAGLRQVAQVATDTTLRAAESMAWFKPGHLTFRKTACRFPVTSGEVLKAYAMGALPVDADDGVQDNEMCLIEIGPAQFLTIPGEPHPEFVQKLVDMMPGQYPFVLAMAQDEIGYIMPKEIFNPAGIQELLSSGRDNELVVLNAASTLLGVQGYVTPACFHKSL